MSQTPNGWRRAFARFQPARWFLLTSIAGFGVLKGFVLASIVGLIVFLILTSIFLWLEASDDGAWSNSAGQNAPGASWSGSDQRSL